MVHRSIISCIYHGAQRALDLVPEFGCAAELDAEIAVYIIGEALCKPLPVGVARNVFEKHQHGELARAGMLEFFLHHEPARRRFPAAPPPSTRRKTSQLSMASRQVLRDELACDGKSSLTRTPSPPACSIPLRAACRYSANPSITELTNTLERGIFRAGQTPPARPSPPDAARGDRTSVSPWRAYPGA